MGQFLSTFFSGSEAQKINLAITGLGSAWPPRVIGPEALEEYIWKTYGKDRPGYASTSNTLPTTNPSKH